MSVRDGSWHIGRAQRLLSRRGAPIAGTEVTEFVVRLLDAVEHGTSDEDAIDGACSMSPTDLSGWPTPSR